MVRRKKLLGKEERIQHLWEEYDRIGESSQSHRTEEDREWAKNRLKDILAEIRKLQSVP